MKKNKQAYPFTRTEANARKCRLYRYRTFLARGYGFTPEAIAIERMIVEWTVKELGSVSYRDEAGDLFHLSHIDAIEKMVAEGLLEEIRHRKDSYTREFRPTTFRHEDLFTSGDDSYEY